MTAAEERAAWAAGDIDRVITAHMHLARREAEKFGRRWHMDADDLASEAFIGLIRAAKKFNPDRGIRYHFYATMWIRAQLWRYIMDNLCVVKIGGSHIQRKLFFQLKQAFMEIESRGGDTSPEALARIFNCDVGEIVAMQGRLVGDVDMDAPVGDDGATVADMISMADPTTAAEHDATHNADMADRLRALVDRFVAARSGGDPRWPRIIYGRLLTSEPETLQDIGDKSNVTRERIRQIEKSIYPQLKAYIEAEAPDIAALFRGGQK